MSDPSLGLLVDAYEDARRVLNSSKGPAYTAALPTWDDTYRRLVSALVSRGTCFTRRGFTYSFSRAEDSLYRRNLAGFKGRNPKSKKGVAR